MDRLTKEQRHRAMLGNKPKDTKPELLLRKALWKKGLKYRKNYKGAFGTPDIAFPKQKIAIFIDGEFWHGYNWEKVKPTLDTNKDYWISKIERNIERDKEVTLRLQQEGWIVLRFWANTIIQNINYCIETIFNSLSMREG